LAAPEKLLPREEIESEFQWDLTAIYDREADWEADFTYVEEKLPEIKKYQGQLTTAEKLRQVLDLTHQINRKLAQLYTYAQRRYDEDTTQSQYQALVSRVQGLYNDFSSATSWLRPEILQIPEEKLTKFLQEEEELQLYEHYLEDIIRQKEHYLSPEEERIVALAGEIAQGPENIFGRLNNADFEFPTIEDENGEEVEVTHGRYVQLLKNSDRRVRKDALQAYYEKYQAQQNTMAATLSTNLKKDVFYMQARHYDSCLQAALDDDNIPVAVYDNLLASVDNNLDFLHKYVQLKKEALDLEELHVYDLYVPLIEEVEFAVDYREAQEIILEALQPLGEEYIEVVKQAFTDGWIDVYENKGKRSGAYSASCYDAHPYILLNYTGEIDDLFTLAHELGHAVHSYYSNREQPYVYSDYSIFVAEVASTVNEGLLIDHLLETTGDEEKRKYLLNHYLEQFRGTVYRQTMFAEFEKKIHAQVEAGQAVTPDLLSKLYHELTEKYYGPTLTVDSEIDVEWARIPHFYYNFYVYQYATGFSAAVALAQKILTGEEGAVTDYLQFLQSGSSDYPLDLLQQAGVDMTDSQPIEQALAVYGDSLTEFKELL